MRLAGLHDCIRMAGLHDCMRMAGLHDYMRLAGLHECMRMAGLHDYMRLAGLHYCMRLTDLHDCVRNDPNPAKSLSSSNPLPQNERASLHQRRCSSHVGGGGSTRHLLTPAPPAAPTSVRVSSLVRRFGFHPLFVDSGFTPAAPTSHSILPLRRPFAGVHLTTSRCYNLKAHLNLGFWNFDALFQPQQHPARDSHDTFFLKPSTTRTLPEDYVERVKRVHESGGYGSMGVGNAYYIHLISAIFKASNEFSVFARYGYEWKREEANKNLLRAHTTAVSSRMLYALAQVHFLYEVSSAGDCVLMRASKNNSAPYLASVEKIEADNRNNVKVRVRWYYMAEESVGGRSQFHGAKELFLSDHYDFQSAHTIEGICTVHTFKNYTKLEHCECCIDYFSCMISFNNSVGWDSACSGDTKWRSYGHMLKGIANLQFKQKGPFPLRSLGPLDPSSRRNVILALTVKGGVMCITIPDRHQPEGSHGNG
ncbi:hypothetical protein BUALT_Bualt02G0102900 [Buddleja alternifolia]|uniref:BAH domain-containing protein n=1 Tax=Buddleja alternifolia TaxID=168488 RepID=A0AAV6Y636_9LAMI|nr:hypothetical protein BUALT_Bualt02G0102900 [Buddleja alternifolia]